ncbi:carbohydrate ABC transporter permease, partial [Streptomyces sp. MCAF7]
MTTTTLSAPSAPVRPAARPSSAPAARRKAVLHWIAVHAVAIAAALFFVLPFVFVFLTSVMSDSQAMSGDLWPNTWHWSNYTEVFNTPGFLDWWRNSLIYAGLGTAFTLISSVPVAYALAKFRFRGRRTAMILVISTMMLPPQVVVVPMYLVWAQQFHLSGSLWPLIIPMAFGDAYSIFLLRQFLLTIPGEYLESAKVDGCGELRT